jgi:hypothetical protein
MNRDRKFLLALPWPSGGLKAVLKATDVFVNLIDEILAKATYLCRKVKMKPKESKFR